jgi:hypothetical protein
MSFPLYPNTTAGLAAVGPVQAMSDRNEAQTYMANGGQMFASGGIASLAEGGSTALPKYKYDPITQRYVLVEDEGKKEKSGLEKLVAQRGVGGEGSADYTPSGWDLMSDKDKAAYYAENPTMSKVTQTLQTIFGRTGLGMAQKALFPDFVARQMDIALGRDPDTPTNTMTERQTQDAIRGIGGGPLSGPAWGTEPDYGNLPGGVTGYQTGENGLPSELGGSAAPGSDSSPGFTGADSNGGFAPSTAGELAQGGLASLARGGMSHLGDYSDGGRLLRGPGDGVSDSIPATIGDKRPARLADGEFVVPARIVSELGNGSTEAGARKLYAMMDRIQKARRKTVGKDRVAVNSRAEKNLPA